jgi:hypothetical protein
MRSRANIVLLVFALALPAAGRGEEISFTASVDRNTISISDQVIYTLTIEGVRDAQPVLPEIPDFLVYRTSSQTQFSLINNQTRVIQTISYTLMPKLPQAGEFTIPSAQLVHGGKTYLSRPIKVRVVAETAPPAATPAALPPVAPAGPPAEPDRSPQPETAPLLYITTEVDREEAYVNEQISLTFKLYRRLQVANLNYSPPPTTGLIEESLGEERSYGQVREGLRYEILELPRAVFPIIPGQLTIGPAELKGDVLIPSRSRRMGRFGFDDFFGDDFFAGAFAERQPFVLRSEPITLTIKPLPREGRPENFRGAVGQFDLQVSASPRAVRAGEPVTVTVKISGRGNLDSVNPPEIPAGEEFQTYSPEVETRKTVSGGRIRGEKIFKQVLIPLTAEVKEVPAVSFSFFDPEREEYRTLTSPPVPIEVEAAPDRETLLLVEDARGRTGREEIRLLGKDILHIKSEPGRLRSRGHPYYRGPIFLGSLLALPGILLAAWAVTARQERLRGDIAYARQVGASRSARRRFREARRLLAAGQGERFYGEVHRAFNRYLGDKFRVPAGAVCGSLIAGKLAARGGTEEIRDEVEDCLAAFDRARFSGTAAPTEEMKAFLSRVENLVGRLEKIKIK